MIETIQFKNINFSYGPETNVLTSANCIFPLNQRVLIRGDSGSGKSTLLKLILGLIEPENGEILFNGENIHELGFERFSEYLSITGHLLDDEGLLSNQSLFDNLALPLIYHKNMMPAERQEWIDRWLSKFSLLGLKESRPAFVTEEVRRVIGFLRALIIKPEMVLLHNPLRGLSLLNQKRVLETLTDFENQYGLKHIIVAADDERIFADKIFKTIEMKEGKIYEV